MLLVEQSVNAPIRSQVLVQHLWELLHARYH